MEQEETSGEEPMPSASGHVPTNNGTSTSLAPSTGTSKHPAW